MIAGKKSICFRAGVYAVSKNFPYSVIQREIVCFKLLREVEYLRTESQGLRHEWLAEDIYPKQKCLGHN